MIRKLWLRRSVASIKRKRARGSTEVSGVTALFSVPKNAVARKLKKKTYGRKGTKGRARSK